MREAGVPVAGRKVGPYTLVSLLKVGGMAEVYLAVRPGPDGTRETVALKQLLEDSRNQEAFRRAFLDEARLTAQLGHINIAQVRDLGEHGNEFFLAIEFIPGADLGAALKRTTRTGLTFPAPVACRIIHDVCLGLHAAHTFRPRGGEVSPIIHRDISPKNVMVSWDGRTKVIDFGIAKAKGRLTTTLMGMVKGTMGYMAPEQVFGEALDGRADLFSATLVLSELLANKRLMQSRSVTEQVRLVDGSFDFAYLEELAVAEPLKAVLRRGLALKRDDRFPNGLELAQALQQASGGLASQQDVARFMTMLFPDGVRATEALLQQAASLAGDQHAVRKSTQLFLKAVGAEITEKELGAISADALKDSTVPAKGRGVWVAVVAGASAVTLLFALFTWMNQQRRREARVHATVVVDTKRVVDAGAPPAQAVERPPEPPAPLPPAERVPTLRLTAREGVHPRGKMPKDSSALDWAVEDFALGFQAQETGDWKTALARFNDCLARDSGYPDCHLFRGQALWVLERFPEAVSAYEQFMQVAPQNHPDRSAVEQYLRMMTTEDR